MRGGVMYRRDNGAGGADDALVSDSPLVLAIAYCVLRTENIFVCWCCVGSDRAAGVGVSLGTLGLVRVDGRPCLGRCSHTTISRLRLSDRPLVLKDRLGPSTIRAAVRRRVPGFFSGARLRAQASAILEALSRTNCTVTIPRTVIRRLHGGG